MGKEPGPKIPYQSLLRPDRDLSRGIAQCVLEQQPEGKQDDQASRSLARGHPRNEGLDHPVHELFQPAGAGPKLSRRAEQMLEKRNQDDQREAVQQRGQKSGEQSESQQSPIGDDQPKEPELGTQGFSPGGG
jgi:hypothetical protein